MDWRYHKPSFHLLKESSQKKALNVYPVFSLKLKERR
jgi:hypothetical protein